jgi:hypothetical protein
LQNESVSNSPGVRNRGISPAEPTGCQIDVEQGSWEWLNIRNTIPTGSKAYDYCVKRRSRKNGQLAPEARDAMEHGKKNEPRALSAYAEKVGTAAKLLPGGMWIHRNVAASPDGITSDGVVVEVKCPYWRSVKDGSIPLQDWWQVQAEMEACGLEEADYVEMSLDGSVSIKRVYKEPRVRSYMQDCFNREKIRREMSKKIKVDD